MNAKKYIVATIALSTVAVAVAASICQRRNCETRSCVTEPTALAMSGPSGKFGPVIEAMLPDPKSADGPSEILNLETGRTLAQPSFENVSSPVEAMIAWPRSHSCDISCFVWPGGAACVTYDMIVVPVESNFWEKATEEELFINPSLAPVSHAPRRLLKLGQNQPDTFIFRTGHGTLGMLRVVGLSQQRPGVTIRYKLINPSKAFLASDVAHS